MKRAQFVTSALASTATLSLPMGAFAATSGLQAIEAHTGGRLGVLAVDMQTGKTVSHRASQRFAMCSTFKFLLCADVLARVDRGIETLERRVRYGKKDLLEYAPVTRANVARGWMTVRELCSAAMEYSDNTAANLLLAAVHGPAGVTHFLRTQGDAVTLLSRYEPALNTAYAGDIRDTTSPEAIVGDMHHFLLGTGLDASSRALLTTWMRKNTTGADSLRAGLPSNWSVGDKTGTGGGINRYGDSDTHNDIAIAFPPGRAPVLIAAYLTGCKLPAARRNAALADVARYVVRTFGL